jgi:hypothetical protein
LYGFVSDALNRGWCQTARMQAPLGAVASAFARKRSWGEPRLHATILQFEFSMMRQIAVDGGTPASRRSSYPSAPFGWAAAPKYAK